YALGSGEEPPNVPPTASFDATTDGLGVAVDASTSIDHDGTITSYAWDFGDGTVASGVTATHSYAAAGTYTITLTVTDDDGDTGPTSRQVTLEPPPPNVPPVADFTVAATFQDVSVDASASSDPDGTVTAYAWDFGDGAVATGVTAEHTYAAGGTYTVTL